MSCTRRGLLALPLYASLPACVQLVDRPLIDPASPNPAFPAGVPKSATMGDWDAAVVSRVARDLARDLTFSPALRRDQRAAVMPLHDATGRSATLAATLTDALRVELVNTGKFAAMVLDHDMRRVLRQLQIEDNMREFGRLDPSRLSRIGQLIPADLIIDGRLTDSATHLRVVVEMSDIARGDVVGTAQQLIEPGMRSASNEPRTETRAEPPRRDTRSSSRAAVRDFAQTLYTGTDWLNTRLESFRPDGQVVRARFSFVNRTGRPVSLSLWEPNRRTFLVDPSRQPLPFVGVEGVGWSGSVPIPQDSRHEVTLSFSTGGAAPAGLTLVTAWRARGTSLGNKAFAVSDLAVTR